MKEGLSSLTVKNLTDSLAQQAEANRDEWEKTTMTRLQQELAKKNQTTLKESEKAIEKRVQEAAKKAAEVKINEETQLMNRKFQEQQEALQRLEAEKQKAIEEEMKLRKAKRVLEEDKKNMDITIERQVDERVSQKAAEQSQLHREQLKERDMEMTNLRKLLKRRNRNLRRGSQQLQGEARELVIEETLAHFCPQDHLAPVPTGKKGADILQRVIRPNGGEAGSIVWESKKVKNWKSDFVHKLKSDQQLVDAEIAVLITTALPKDATDEPAQLYQDVWLIQPHYVGSFAQVLRQQLISVSQTRQVAEQKGDYKDVLYNHIFSEKFVMQMKQIHELMERQRSDLAKESRKVISFCKKRKTDRSEYPEFYADDRRLAGLVEIVLPDLNRLAL